MSDFNISKFITIMKTGLAENNTQEAAGRLLLESVTKQDGVLVDVDSKMISNLVKAVSIDGAAPLHYLCIAYLQKKEPKAIITFYPAEMHAFTLCPSDKHSVNPCLF